MHDLYPINYSGHPAILVPAGMAEDNRPVGMQIIGRRYDDLSVITAASALEQVWPWRDTYALCADRPI